MEAGKIQNMVVGNMAQQGMLKAKCAIWRKMNKQLLKGFGLGVG
jgi:hypothetical protein